MAHIQHRPTQSNTSIAEFWPVDMNMPNPLWMQPPTLAPGPRHAARHQPGQEHLSWPWKLPIKDSVGFELEEILRRNQGKGCQMVKYLFNADAFAWRFNKATTIVEDIKDMVSWAVPRLDHKNRETMFLMASSLGDEAIRALGFWMNISPSFFMMPDVRLRVVAGADAIFFTLQYMNRHAVGHGPLQEQQSMTSQQYRFRSTDGHQPHEWQITQARLIFTTRRCEGPLSDSNKRECACWKGLYIFNEEDAAMAVQLKDLMTASDRPDPKGGEVFLGSGQIIQDVIFLINSKWAEFFDEADLHLRTLSKQCVSESLLPEKQLQYTRELHELSPLWTSVRRHLTAIRDLIAQVLQHEISSSNPNLGDRTDTYYVKRLQVIEDHVTRCNDAAAQTNNLISLIFNIATLQESRAAVEESKAANAFAGSIQRVTMLTFIYLPLTLASSILGMNITQITGEATHSQMWLYVVIAIALMTATFGGWLVWSISLSNIECRMQRRSSTRVAKKKCV